MKSNAQLEFESAELYQVVDEWQHVNPFIDKLEIIYDRKDKVWMVRYNWILPNMNGLIRHSDISWIINSINKEIEWCKNNYKK